MRQLLYVLFVLAPLVLSGQIDLQKLEKDFGKGEITLKKKVKISFFLSEEDNSYQAKVTHSIEKLFINEESSEGMVQLPFNEFQELRPQKARYYKLDSLGNKTLIENVKVKYIDTKDYFVNNIFYADLKVKQFKCEVFLPKTYVVNYSYDIIYKDLRFLSSFYFQHGGEAVREVQYSIKKNPSIDLAIYEFNLNGEISKSEDEYYIKYSGNDLKRFENNRYAVGQSYYLPHLIISVKSVTDGDKKIEVLNSIKNQYDWYRKLTKELNPDLHYMNELSAFITEGKSTDAEKIEAIFQWVQQNIQYVAFENGIAGFKPAESDEVAKTKYGDCKGMANLLVELLQSQGFDANHAWIGTRNRNYSYSMPSLAVDNHMICALNYKDDIYYLDGTSKSATWRLPPPSLEGKEVMVSQEDDYRIDTIPISKAEDNRISIDGTIDLKTKHPKVSMTFKIYGHFIRKYVGYENYLASGNKDNIPYYFTQKYLDGLSVESISNPEFREDYIEFTIQGTYLNFARNSQNLTVFPFLNLLKYPYLKEKTVPTYIEFPYIIESNIRLTNSGGRLIQATNEFQELGNEDYYARFAAKQDGATQIVQQKLCIRTLNSPIGKSDEWNEFTTELKKMNLHPLTYSFEN